MKIDIINPVSWKCPFCNHYSTINQDNFRLNKFFFGIANKHGNKEINTKFIVCSNMECKEYTLIVDLYNVEFSDISDKFERSERIQSWNLIPRSNAKIFPFYVPKAIIDDYNEACLILNLSPKASATLSRRCLQGMIRDYFNISRNKLIEEILAIEQKVDPLTWQAIDSVRKIGNIGAHMEKEIDHIIDVDPNEAEILIELIEQLIEDWYVLRYERNLRQSKIVSIAEAKTKQKGNN